MYADSFLDHFRRPRGQGSLSDATHSARREDPACGDVLELDLRVASGRVEAIRFRASGCMGSIAVGSALATLLPGRGASPEVLTRDEIERELGGVPATKRHALRLALDTLREALASPVDR